MSASWKIYTLSQNDLQLEVLPGVGGRLWDVNFKRRSLLFQNPELIEIDFAPEQLSQLPTRSPQFNFPLWGGEKTWIAPDSQWQNNAPYPILDSGPYDVISADRTQIHLRSTTCPDSGMQIERAITLLSGSSWSIQHSLINQGTSDRYAGIWSVLMLDQPAQIGLNTGHLETPKPVFGNADGLVQTHGHFSLFDCHKLQEFKLGTNNPTGKTIIRIPNRGDPLWMSCQTGEHSEGNTYAHGHDFEVFNSGDYAYCEAEWHSPAQVLQPGASITFLQEFQLRTEQNKLTETNIPSDEAELISLMA